MLSRNPTVLIVNDTAFAHGGLLPMHGARLGERARLPAPARPPLAGRGSASPPARPAPHDPTAHPHPHPCPVDYGIERMNAEVAAWMRRDRTDDGFASPPFLAMGDGKSVMWNRQLSVEKWPNPIDRFHAMSLVGTALSEVGASRLVVGHTPQVRGASRRRGGGSGPAAAAQLNGSSPSTPRLDRRRLGPALTHAPPQPPTTPRAPQMRGANSELEGLVWRMDVGMSSGVLDAPVSILEITKDPATGEDTCRIVTQGEELASFDELEGLVDF
jgi:hypothetical protein